MCLLFKYTKIHCKPCLTKYIWRLPVKLRLHQRRSCRLQLLGEGSNRFLIIFKIEKKLWPLCLWCGKRENAITFIVPLRFLLWWSCDSIIRKNEEKSWKCFFWNNRYHNCKSRGVHKEGERASSGGQETETKVSCNLSSNYNRAYHQAQAIKKQRQVETARVAFNWFLCFPSWTRGNVKTK